jgi:hypothetical protein
MKRGGAKRGRGGKRSRQADSRADRMGWRERRTRQKLGVGGLLGTKLHNGRSRARGRERRGREGQSPRIQSMYR